jgi:hypothetical protein
MPEQSKLQTLDRAGFEFTPRDILLKSMELPGGFVTQDPEVEDHTAAVLATAEQLVQGAAIKHLWATPEGAVAKDPLEPNIVLVLSSGKQLHIMGDWRIRVSERYEAEVAPCS